MARWKLSGPHYLKVMNIEWEYSQIDDRGRARRHRFPVPMLLDPKAPTDCNHPEHGIVVSNKLDDRFPDDYVFEGDPTPDMVPLDAEAEAITASLATKWKHPIENIGDYSQAILRDIEKEVDIAMRRANTAPQAPNAAIPSPEFEALKQQMAEMQGMMKSLVEENTALKETKEQPAPAAATGRR